MLTLHDFLHLPQLDPLLERILAQESGLVVIAGPDARPQGSPGEHARDSGYLIPGSGRESLLRVLLDGILDSRPKAHALVVSTNPKSFHLPKRLKKQAETLAVESDSGYAAALARALATRPHMVALEKLDSESLPLALSAARKGTLILAGLDSVFYGAEAARHLQEMAGGSPLDGLAWIVSVQRLPALCPACRRPVEPGAGLQGRLQPALELLAALPAAPAQPGMQPAGLNQSFCRHSGGCPACQMSGYSGEALAFDIYAHEPESSPRQPQSLLPMLSYGAGLAAAGRVDGFEMLDLPQQLFRRTFLALQDSERRLSAALSGLVRRRAELEAAQRVLETRTRSLVTFQEIGQALTGGEALEELAQRVCKRASELCGAEQAVLYYLRRQGNNLAAQVLAATGWEAHAAGGITALDTLPLRPGRESPLPYRELPPGLRLPLPPGGAPDAAPKITCGIAIPLLAQSVPVGLMIVQSTRKQAFSPSESAMLETYAHQAALALQRSGLVEELRARVVELEAAHAGLAQKERLERELELARQVQQALLPVEFPHIPGFQAAAGCLPARQVGGDFYDLFVLDGDHFGLAIGDVSDKGMPAALYMALTRSLLRAEAARSRSPAAVLQQVNRLLQELGRPELFVTIFYGVIQRSTLRLAFARAGHDRPLLLRGKELQELDGDGIPLGLFLEPEFRLEERSLLLEPGDRLLLYTDGLCDALDPQGQDFGRARLLALLQAAAGLEPHALCQEVLERIGDFQAGAEQYDDITLMALRVSGEE